jgi:quercetin dioxygenase-like cupin family protein
MTQQKITAALPVNMKELIDYSNHSIVSSTIIKNEAGTVTLFAFDAGQDLSEHTAPFDALLQVLEGEANITIDQNSLIVNEGETIMMPAHIPHSVAAEKKFKMLLTMIKG